MDLGFLEVSSRKRKRRISDNRSKLPSNIQNAIEKLFEKKFSYEKKEDYNLKASFKEKRLYPLWQIKEFMTMKNELNMLKNELNDKDMITWHEHTRLVNLAGNIAPEVRHQVRPELCTQAWCKFYEIASVYIKMEDRVSFNTVHLCEAPGAFVTSLNHYLFTHSYDGDWQWLAATLNPYYEGNNIGQMIDEDRFISCSYGNWYFGEDGTGNLMSDVNLAGLKERLLKQVMVDLVTADGSIDCQGDPAEQENVVSRLQHCEVLTALHILSPGGTLVVKMFTLFECKAIGLMYVLNCVFDKVEVFKPCTSKGGNSEVYVIGLEFKGRECCEGFLRDIIPVYFGVNEPDGCLFARDDIPESFLHQHAKCVEFFKDCQMTSIQRNLDLFKVMNDEERSVVEEQKDYCMECFFNRYDMKSLSHSRRMMKLLKGRKPNAGRNTEFAAKVKLEGKFTGSFCERQELSTLPWQQKINKIETYEEEVDRENNSLWIQCQGEDLFDEEVGLFQAVRGKPVDSIQSSRFCHGFYLSQVREIITQSQWLPMKRERETEFTKRVAQKLNDLLCETIQYYNDRPKHELQVLTHQTSTMQTQDLSAVNNVVDENVEQSCVETLSSEVDGEIKEITAGKDNPKLKFTLVKNGSAILEELSYQDVDGCTNVRQSTGVRLYAVSLETVCANFELVEQRGLLSVVQDILKNCKASDYVVIEMGACLSRFTAGLVYILYRCFREVGFVHHHGNLLKRHLVCVNYQHCPIRLCQYVEEVDHMMIETNQSASVLEIIPVLTLLKDEGFTSFLRISNVNLLQSFITTVVNQEKQMFSLGDKT